MIKPKKSIWIINQYATTPDLDGDGHRHYYLAKEWIKKGYDVTLITSAFSHIGNKNIPLKGFFKVIDNHEIKTVLIRGYKYKNSNGFQRILSWLYFSFLLFFLPLKKITKPDVIIVSSISLLPILNVVYFFKRKFKDLKFILEIRDIWPLTLIEIGNYSPKNPLIKFLAFVEKKGYKSADHIVSLLIDAKDHISKVCPGAEKKFTWVSNGYNIESEDYYKPLPDEITQKIPKNKFIVGYAGALGLANAMETMIDTILELDDDDIVLCLLGKGNEMKNLKDRAKNDKRIIFLGSVNKNQVQSFLSYCDILFFSSKNLPIYRFGIAANKTFDYMYSKKPIILSSSKHRSIIEIAKCGSLVPAQNSSALKNKIKEFYEKTDEDRKRIGLNGRVYLEENFTYEILANKYDDIFCKL